jgi:hypothetical protein
MLFSFALLSILAGVAILGFGLFLFYAWLPLFYGLFGFEIGLLLGTWLTGDAGLTAIILGVICALILAAATYVLEPYRRLVLGFSGGAVVALSLAYLLGLDRMTGGILGIVLAVCGGVFGAAIAMKYFDLFVIALSAFGGATLIVTGALLLLSFVAEPNRVGILPMLLTVVLTVIGVRWQLGRLAAWVPAQFLPPEFAADPVVNQTKTTRP